jgi:glycerol uptake facilitator-like aquaporin
MLMKLTAGGISGAHLNPAVTVSLACAKQLNWKKIPLYFLAQYLGAFLASAIVYIVYIGN